jgi:hypothetical protein
MGRVSFYHRAGRSARIPNDSAPLPPSSPLGFGAVWCYKYAIMRMILMAITLILTLPAAKAETYESITREAYATPADAAASVQKLGLALRKHGNRRGLFALVYAQTIAAANQKLARGEFKNPAWVSRLIVNYANLYRRTIRAELAGQRASLPKAWQVEFNYIASTTPREWSADLDVVYGINVHIARDLVEALLITPTDFRSPSVKSDYFLITEALNGAMPGIWDTFMDFSRSFRFLPGLQRDVMITWIGDLRYLAWLNAVEYSGHDQAGRARLVRELDAKVAKRSLRYGTALPLLPRPQPGDEYSERFANVFVSQH